jgi:hypothetical protein
MDDVAIFVVRRFVCDWTSAVEVKSGWHGSREDSSKHLMQWHQKDTDTGRLCRKRDTIETIYLLVSKALYARWQNFPLFKYFVHCATSAYAEIRFRF